MSTIQEVNGRFTCVACGREWSAMAGDDEVPEKCNCGTVSDFDIEAEVQCTALREYTVRNYGERCEDYEPDCAVCRAWRIVDLFTDLNS